MRLDVRIPIGSMFSLLGALLTVFGLLSDPEMYQRSAGLNVNFYWGLVLLGVGIGLLLLARRGRSSARPSEQPSDSTRRESHEAEPTTLAR